MAVDAATARQLEVVDLLARGLRYREVASRLSISEGQVQRHVSHAVARSGARGVYDLVATAIATGLVPAGAR